VTGLITRAESQNPSTSETTRNASTDKKQRAFQQTLAVPFLRGVVFQEEPVARLLVDGELVDEAAAMPVWFGQVVHAIRQIAPGQRCIGEFALGIDVAGDLSGKSGSHCGIFVELCGIVIARS
jgi:hypothetical protein